jgi:tetratricopeptide (TPR) repeat protein
VLSAGVKDLLLLAVIVVAGYAAVYCLSNRLETVRPQLPDEYVDSDLTVNGSRLKGFSFGAEGLIADYYFMRSLQYIGDKILKSNDEVINIDDLRGLNPRLLYPMLNNATDLDPHFVAAYSYGAVVLPAIDPQKAIAFATKGVENNPDQWRLYQHLAYIYWKLGKFEKAAEIYERGSEIPGASPFMKMMAASMKTKGGSHDTARAIYQEMLVNSDDEQVKITAQRRLNELDSLDERDAINKALADIKQSTGLCANSLAEVLPLLRNVALPNGRDFRIDPADRLVDPTDAPYLLDRENCRVTLDVEHTGLPLK